MKVTLKQGDLEVDVGFKAIVVQTDMPLHCVNYRNSVSLTRVGTKLTVPGFLPADLEITVRKRTLWDVILRN